MMHAWRGLKGSKQELIRVRVQSCRTRQAESEKTMTAAEAKAKEVREQSRVRKQQERFRDIRDDNLPDGEALAALEILIAECALDCTALFERNRVFGILEWFVWWLDPDVVEPPVEDGEPMGKLWALDKKGWRIEMYWHAAHLAVSRDFDVYDGTAITCIAALWRAVHNYPNDEDIQAFVGRVLVLIVSTLRKMSEGFVFIYMFPALVVRDLTMTPTVWMQRVLASICLQWQPFAAARLPYIVWSQLHALVSEDFNGWAPGMDVDDGNDDDNDDDDNDDNNDDDDDDETCAGPFPRATEEELSRRTFVVATSRKH